MVQNSNRIILAVAALLAISLIALLVSAGSCTAPGGGTATSPGPSSAGGNPANQASMPSGGGADSGASSEMTIEEYRAELASLNSPVGANARSATSSNMQTGSEARASFDNRGFNGVSVVADIDSQGSYIGDTVVEASSSERYPVYTGEHLSPSGVIWGIYVNDGAFYASPLAIGENAVNKNVIVTEADVVTQYDAMKNEFSDFTVQECLNDGVAVLKVDRIDLATLDAYTAEQIGAL